MFERCLLWYYFHYYGARAGTAKDEPRKQELRFLKKLSNRHLRAGEIMHLVIRTYLKQLKEGEEWTLDRLLRWARDIYRGDFLRSVNYQRGARDHDPQSHSVLLAEFYFDIPDAKLLWEGSAARLVKALTNFMTHPGLERFRRGPTPSVANRRNPSLTRGAFPPQRADRHCVPRRRANRCTRLEARSLRRRWGQFTTALLCARGNEALHMST